MLVKGDCFMTKEKNGKDFNFKITVAAVIAAVWIVCIALLCTKCELDKRKSAETSGSAQTEQQTLAEEYKVTEEGSVKTDKSKTKKYFDSHYKGDYSTVTEYRVDGGENGEYSQTEEISYSAKGYKYKKVTMLPYDDTEFSDSDSIVYLYTPDKRYLIYPGTGMYTEAENDMSEYENAVTFENAEFKTGSANINGTEFYCESTVSSDGTKTSYCFDKDDNLKYVLTDAENGSVLTTYISYSENVDYSLFELPEGYKPMS